MSDSKIKVRFNNLKDKDFVSELKNRVDSYFKDNNLSQTANRKMLIKTISLLLITYVPYFLIIFAGLNPWIMLGLCAIMGFGIACMGFNIGHDALHGAYSNSRMVNKILGFSFNIVGANDYFWKIKHNVRHHTYTNIYEHDEDLEVAAWLRLSPHAPYHKAHRIQHITAFLSYCLLTLHWVFASDYIKIRTYNGKGSPDNSVKHPRNEMITLFAFKAFYYFYMIVIPLMVLPLPFWQILIGFLTMHFVSGFVLSIVFQLAHVVEDTVQYVPEANGTIDNAWAIHQLKTTANFSVNSQFMTWVTGGLNFQVEHHIFPNICSVHYPDISKIVKKTAQEYGIVYNDTNSFRTGVVSHYRILKELSKPNPVMSWELDPVKIENK